jgi:hypothetical protein
LDSGIRPFLHIGIGNVKSRDTHGKDLVSGLGDVALDSFLVGIAED